MYSAEVLSQLRSLNWLAQEIRRVPAGSREAAYLQSQVDALRARLPTSILEHHDRLAKGGKVSAAQVRGDRCAACQAQISPALLLELVQPGRFGVCLRCGLFLWVDESHESAAQSDPKLSVTKVRFARGNR